MPNNMAPSPLPIVQINLHHSKGASAILTRHLAGMQTAIAIVQEPWLLNNAIKGLGGCGSVYYANTQEKIRTCIITKGLNANFIPQVSDGDLTVVQLSIALDESQHMELLVGSVYLPYDSIEPPPSAGMKRLIDYAEGRGLELLLGCDANSHHVGWGSTNVNPRGESLHEFIMSTNLTILNRGTEPTFMDRRRQEVIDITFATEWVAGLVGDWRVSTEPSGSDHRQLRLSLCYNSEKEWARNPRRTNWLGYRADLKNGLQQAPTRFHTKDQLEVAARFISEAIKDAYESNCQLRPTHCRSKVPWWNQELAGLRTRVRRAFNRAKSTNIETNWNSFRNLQKEYSKAIIAAKRKSWRNFCAGIESLPEASRLARIVSKTKSTHLGCLKRPDGSYTETLDETLKLLMETHFPGFRADSEDNETANPLRAQHRPKEWSLAAKVVNPQGVEWAIRSFEPYKAPGPDGVYPILLQEGLDSLVGPLTKVLRASIAHRHVPQAWNGAKIAFIPKPGRNGCQAKDFRPISLTSFVLKTLERLVDRFLKAGPLSMRPLSSPQYAYREGRSTDTALHHLVGKVEEQLAAKGYAIGVFLDVEGAFDSTSHDVIRRAMTNHGIPEILVDWTQSMLKSRRLLAQHGKTQVRGRPTKGCPQGGVLSPLLWCLVVNELLILLQEAGLLVFGYADDVAIVARGSFLSTLRELIVYALRIIQNWCAATGLTVNPSKTAAMIFTRRYKVDPIPPLKLWDEEIEFTTSAKYLGVHLDNKLSWKYHLDVQRKKLFTSMWACRRAMGKTWGLRPKVALWIYKAVLLPRLTYASLVWWPRVVKVGSRNLLKSLQGGYLRAAVGAMRTTPTEALEVALGYTPLDLWIISRARLTAYRLQCQGEWKPTSLGHTGLALIHEQPFTLKQDRIPRKYLIGKTFKVYMPTRENWQEPKQSPGPRVDFWYTDGSGYKDRFGAGIYGPKTNHRESIPMGSHATVFQAEVLAILKCATYLVNNTMTGRHVYICTDSQAAIEALAKPTTESSVVWECMQMLETLAAGNKLTLLWVPAHQGIHGNEVADGLAKKGALVVPNEQPGRIPFAVGKNLIRTTLERDHLDRWRGLTTCRQSKLLMAEPLQGRTKELLAMDKRRLRMAIGLLTGHASLRAHEFNLGLAAQTECRLCGAEKEDSIHILCDCPALARRRQRIWGRMFLCPKDLNEVRVGSLLSLVCDAGLGLIT